jgi:DNA invertase Pin-like site-specific DNA recombinase
VKALKKAVAYLRTSSWTNVDKTAGDKDQPVTALDGKDSDKRQRLAINAYAKAAGYAIVDEFYDKAVKGSDPVDARPEFARMLVALLANGARTIIVESPDRFARDLIQQLLGHDMLKAKGIELIAASAPQHFLEDTPTAVLIRQVLGGVAQFEKTTLVAKLAAARKRKRDANGKCEGRKSLVEISPEAVALAKKLRRYPVNGHMRSFREIAAELEAAGFVTRRGTRYGATAVARMVGAERRAS